MGPHALRMRPPSHRLDTMRDRFSCSAYVSSRRFSLSVTSRPLYEDHDHHSMAERAFPLQLWLCGSQEHSQLVGLSFGIAVCSALLYPLFGSAPLWLGGAVVRALDL